MGPTKEHQREKIREFNRQTAVPIQYKKKKKKKNKYDIYNLSDTNELVDVAEHYRSQLVKNATKQERLLCDYLDNHNVKYQFQCPVYIRGKLYILDFYIEQLRLNIECDGYYHFNKLGRERDAKRDKNLTSKKIRVLRLRNDIFKDFNKVYNILHRLGVL
jgi:very-short-patch-repair endonuclease